MHAIYLNTIIYACRHFIFSFIFINSFDKYHWQHLYILIQKSDLLYFERLQLAHFLQMATQMYQIIPLIMTKICQNYLRSSVKLAIEIKYTTILNGIFPLDTVFVVMVQSLKKQNSQLKSRHSKNYLYYIYFYV